MTDTAILLFLRILPTYGFIEANPLLNSAKVCLFVYVFVCLSHSSTSNISMGNTSMLVTMLLVMVPRAPLSAAHRRCQTKSSESAQRSSIKNDYISVI